MNPINFLFFAIASMIGLEDSRIVSRKVNITVHPVEKTFEIIQEDLFAIVILPEDSVAVANEIRQIVEFQSNTDAQNRNGLTVDKILLDSSNQQLNAVITVNYTDPKVLEDAGIYFDTETSAFKFINIPEWNIRSSDSVLKDDNWTWTPHQSVTLVIEPFEKIPEEYLHHRQSMLPYWRQSQKGQR